MKGGYAGLTAVNPNVRDPRAYETVLSGDLNGDDIEVAQLDQLQYEPTRADNSACIVTGSGTDATARFDGFAVTGAHGSAMFNDAGSPTVVDCVFRGNSAANLSAAHLGNVGVVVNRDGGPTFSRCTFEQNGAMFGTAGMYNDNAAPEIGACMFSGNVSGDGGCALLNRWYSRPLLTDCVFTDNQTSWYGGAMYNNTASIVELHNCRFERNRAKLPGVGGPGRGGAIYSEDGELRLEQCLFRENAADREGGAVCVRRGTLLLSRCTFADNRANLEESLIFQGGGALDCGAYATLTGCTFTGNSAIYGGAVYIRRGSHVGVTACRFEDNVAFATEDGWGGGEGGAFFSDSAWVRLTDCTFAGNGASDYGGAVHSGRDEYLAIDRCAFVGNQADSGGGLFVDGRAFFHDVGPAPTLANCLFTGNRARRGGALYCVAAYRQILENCTFASNSADEGPALVARGLRTNPVPFDLTHCIIRDGPDFLWHDESAQVTVRFSNVQGGYPGLGNIDVDPLFVAPGCWANGDDPNAVVEPDDPSAVWIVGDYHLQSQAGHWDQEVQAWVRDENSSPCIDAGSLSDSFGDESFPNGGILNLGAYGGTAHASKSYFGEPLCDAPIAGDINGDCRVDFSDLQLMALNWLRSRAPVSNQPPAVVIVEPVDGAVIETSESDPTVQVTVEAVDADGLIREVRFEAEYRERTRLLWTAWSDDDGSDGWQWSWLWWGSQDGYPQGQYTLRASAVDNDGALVFAPEVVITVRRAE